MKSHLRLTEIISGTGAELRLCGYDPSSRSYDVELWAPDGMQWVNSGTSFIGGVYFNYIKGSKEECYADLCDRASDGLEPLDHDL